MLLGCRLLSNVSRKFPGQPLFCNIRNFSKERAGKSVRPGCAIILDGQPHKCVKMIQGKRGKGGGFVKATLKNLISGNTYEKTFTSDEIVEHAELERKTASFSWSDENNYIFMDLETFEEIILPKEEVELGDFLTPGLELKLQLFRDAVIGVELPLIIEYTIAERLPSGRAPSELQPATLKGCTATVHVPDFITEGSRIRVAVNEGTYVDRA